MKALFTLAAVALLSGCMPEQNGERAEKLLQLNDPDEYGVVCYMYQNLGGIEPKSMSCVKVK